jgi:hypothetical protein
VNANISVAAANFGGEFGDAVNFADDAEGLGVLKGIE